MCKRATDRSIAPFNGKVAYKFLSLSKSLLFIYKINKLKNIFVLLFNYVTSRFGRSWVAGRSKAWVCGRSLVGIAGSNLAVRETSL